MTLELSEIDSPHRGGFIRTPFSPLRRAAPPILDLTATRSNFGASNRRGVVEEEPSTRFLPDAKRMRGGVGLSPNRDRDCGESLGQVSPARILLLRIKAVAFRLARGRSSLFKLGDSEESWRSTWKASCDGVAFHSEWDLSTHTPNCAVRGRRGVERQFLQRR